MVYYALSTTQIPPPSDRPGDPSPLELFLYISKPPTGGEPADKPGLVSHRTTIDLWNSNRSAACNELSEKLSSSFGIESNWMATLIRLIERSVGHRLKMRPHQTLALHMDIITTDPRSAPPHAGEDHSPGGCWEELRDGAKGPEFRFKFHP